MSNSGLVVTTFFEEQSARDAILALNIANGHIWTPGVRDECRRWSLCDRCEVESPELRLLWEQIAWEDDHECFGCAAVVDGEPLEAEELIFPFPEPYVFARRLEDLDATIHVHRRVNDGFTSGRTPQAPRKAA